MSDKRISSKRSTPGLHWAIPIVILGLTFAASACQDAPDRAARGPSDRIYNRAKARSMQDSLRAMTEARQFTAVMTSDPFNPSATTAEVRLALSGVATYATTTAAKGAIVTRFMLRPEGASRSLLDLQLRRQEGAGRAVMGGRDSVTVEQQDRYPNVEASVGEGRQRYRSRSGYLTLTRGAGERLEGRFYFEMRRVGESEENWFELVGTFEVEPERPVEAASYDATHDAKRGRNKG